MMTSSSSPRMGFTCAYTPIALIHAAGFTPYRILPLTEAPDQAGAHLHDNLCPHVKKVLDRVIGGDMPELEGVVIMESCDTMRRLADAWRNVRPEDKLVTVDLPMAQTESAVLYFARELEKLGGILSEWAGTEVTGKRLLGSLRHYNGLADGLACLADRAAQGSLAGGWATLQRLYNASVTRPIDDILSEVERLEAEKPAGNAGAGAVPVYMFGNVLADPEAFDLVTDCGARLVGDDLCTGSRQIVPMKLEANGGDPIHQYARALLMRPVCARTLPAEEGHVFAEQVLASARAKGARGVIAHVMKFCDPYLARMPTVRDRLRKAGMPLLVLEGDCTLRSLGQHRTRIEAFVEILAEGSP